jgi:hypothetical protein
MNIVRLLNVVQEGEARQSHLGPRFAPRTRPVSRASDQGPPKTAGNRPAISQTHHHPAVTSHAVTTTHSRAGVAPNPLRAPPAAAARALRALARGPFRPASDQGRQKHSCAFKPKHSRQNIFTNFQGAGAGSAPGSQHGGQGETLAPPYTGGGVPPSLSGRGFAVFHRTLPTGDSDPGVGASQGMACQILLASLYHTI